MNIDNVADVMDDITEQMQLAEELDEAMAQPLGQPLDEVLLMRIYAYHYMHTHNFLFAS